VAGAAPTPRRFVERPTAPVVPDAWGLAAVPALAAAACGAAGWGVVAVGLAALAGFVVFFFRNPDRRPPPDPAAVVAPADGRVLHVDEIEEADGGKALRIAIFLSVLDVHVNRMPLAGRVVAVERAGRRFRAAFDSRAEADNARCTLTLETAEGLRFRVVQIVGLVARRIVCHPRVGEWVERGERFGLIRFGSRTDVVLPAGAVPRVRRGDRVRGGSSVVAHLGEAA